jgi:hypothetical protein
LRRPTFHRAAINPPRVSSYFPIRMAGFIGIHLLGLDPSAITFGTFARSCG